MTRTDLLRSLIDTTGLGLEIGPSYNPLVPKAAGFQVEVADYLDAAGLRAKYLGNASVDPAVIEEVDHVLGGSASLAEQIGKPGHYDYIVASHVIEHVPDLLGFLQSCQALLQPDGVLLLAVPDKRHCFDVLQPLTSTGGVLQAHLERHTRPSPGAVFDDRAYNAVRDGAIGWGPGDAGTLQFFATLQTAQNALAASLDPAVYLDVHIWRFVPSSFRLIVRDLAEIGEIWLQERSFHDSVGNEFYLTMSRTAHGCPIDRMTLAMQTLAEAAAVSR